MKQTSFTELIERLLSEKRVEKGDIQILGGTIKEENLQEFIGKWNLKNTPYAIIETLEEITITKNPDPSKLESEQVERVRIFGDEGDLDIRRHTNTFSWRYLGKGTPPPDIEKEDFWKKYPEKKFFTEEKEALLWGKYNPKKKTWHIDRVAKAKLNYPIQNPEQNQLPKIRYKTLSEGGIISFVWLIEIK